MRCQQTLWQYGIQSTLISLPLLQVPPARSSGSTPLSKSSIISHPRHVWPQFGNCMTTSYAAVSGPWHFQVTCCNLSRRIHCH
ncbi:hypothetical protein M378DRAFT_652272 [Amanita muscaria Koide BX008]|uniref:Uncharacterized protein n=1 Tax=Amanita muscaria (strain Koide BX008) TaxID=946122 RepID=A0A0C2WG72_AMAMK|nr:hypothetical protein M378DRAFT_652272 [Amanita muscaria Koide BX008]